MTTNAEIKLESDKYVMNTYARLPVAFVKGRGISLWDADGREYQDFLAGLAVSCLGHAHPNVVEAIRAQAGELLHTSNLYLIANQAKLARYLVDQAYPGKVFFCNSGAEANESALKLARRWQEKIAGKPDRKEVLSFEHSFHGRTLATLAATAQSKYHDGFAPLPAGFHYAVYNDLDSTRRVLDEHPAVGAIIVECVQAEGGVIPASQEFLKGLRQLATERDLVLIFDEVQTGIGRCGAMFAWQGYGVAPDVMSLAKGLGAGVPIGAIVATEKFAAGFAPGAHASTFGGNHLACAVGLAVIKTFLNDQIPERVAATGKYVMDQLKARAPRGVVEIRGRGLLIGIELDRPAGPYVTKMLEKGYVIGTAGEKVVRLAPPLIVSQAQCGKMLDVLVEVINA